MRLLFLFTVLFLSACATQEPDSAMCSRCISPSASNGYSAFFSVRNDAQPDLAAIAEKSCAPFNGVKVKPWRKEHYAIYDWYAFQCNGFTAVRPTPAVESVVQQPKSNVVDFKLQIEDAKQKCTELGFKANTESFGKCVLKLSN